ncbi:MAG TPA: MazG family protein [Marmoricola sp.]|nr:MazG family protein [Marmoricola sp.]
MTQTEHPLVVLVDTMARLRRECAWKAEQTHASLARYLLEEAHETVEAIESGDSAHLREELGDLLLQVYFHAAIAAEAGEYDVADVAADLQAKLIRRNPHVFGPAGQPLDAEQINEQWEQIKRAEKQRTDPVEGIPPSLPALLYADKVIDRVTRAGGVVAPAGDGLGDRLLALALEAHAAGQDAEQALRAAVRQALGDQAS